MLFGAIWPATKPVKPMTQSSPWPRRPTRPDRKSTRLNSSHTEIYTLSLHDALPISYSPKELNAFWSDLAGDEAGKAYDAIFALAAAPDQARSEEHTSELQSHRDLHSFPTRRSSDLLFPERTECFLERSGRRRSR